MVARARTTVATDSPASAVRTAATAARPAAGLGVLSSWPVIQIQTVTFKSVQT